jgi:hypothetical protein
VRNLVEFKALKPDSILGLFKDGLTIQSIMGKADGKMTSISKSMESSGFQPGQSFNKLSPFLMALAFLVVFLFGIIILKKFSNLSETKKEKLDRIL